MSRLVEEGGDWDRRNRLKVYRAVLHLSSREFSKAAELLLVSACALLGTVGYLRFGPIEKDSLFFVTACTTH